LAEFAKQSLVLPLPGCDGILLEGCPGWFLKVSATGAELVGETKIPAAPRAEGRALLGGATVATH